MKRLFLIATMIVASLCAQAQQQQQYFYAYMVCTTYPWEERDTTTTSNVWIGGTNKMIKLESAKRSTIDALNFMASLGWEVINIIQTKSTSSSYTEAVYLRKRARNISEAYKGIK